MNKKRTNKRQWLWEFIKKIVVAVTVIFVIAFVFTVIQLALWPDINATVDFFREVKDVFIAVVVSYAVKAGFENVTKIRRNPGGVTDDPYKAEEMNNE